MFRSPTASPLTRPTTVPAIEQNAPPQPPTQSAESLLEFVKTFCSDEFALRRFYENFSSEAMKPRASPSPHLGIASTSIGEDRIPTLGLPPSLIYREGSPMRLITAGEGVPSRRTPSAESEKEDGKG